jgi:predicted DNA-binding transcriptional regulator AlpA
LLYTNERAGGAMVEIMPGLLKSKELAILLGFQESTLRQWRTEGIGPPYLRLGRRVRYNADAVNAWLDAHQVDGYPRNDG